MTYHCHERNVLLIKEHNFLHYDILILFNIHHEINAKNRNAQSDPSLQQQEVMLLGTITCFILQSWLMCKKHVHLLTLIFQELSHLTSLKFLPRLALLLMKHTLRIFTGPVYLFSTAPAGACGGPGRGGFHDNLLESPDILQRLSWDGLLSWLLAVWWHGGEIIHSSSGRNVTQPKEINEWLNNKLWERGNWEF